MIFTQDYGETMVATKRYDLHYQIIEPSLQPIYNNFTFELNNSIRVTGPYKPVNRWLKLFLTPKNSHPIRRSEGTDFYNMLGTNLISFEDFQMQLQEYMDDASEQLKKLDAKTFLLPPEEAFDRAELIDINQISTVKFEIHIRIFNRRGTSVTVLIPYASVDG